MPWIILVLAVAIQAGEWQAVEVEATGYCPCKICCGHLACGVTADGTRTSRVPYGIAAVFSTFPAGTFLYIPPGVGYLEASHPTEDSRQFVVDDTGGGLRGEEAQQGVVRIDLRFKYHNSAKRFGRKRITIYRWIE